MHERAARAMETGDWWMPPPPSHSLVDRAARSHLAMWVAGVEGNKLPSRIVGMVAIDGVGEDLLMSPRMPKARNGAEEMMSQSFNCCW